MQRRSARIWSPSCLQGQRQWGVGTQTLIDNPANQLSGELVQKTRVSVGHVQQPDRYQITDATTGEGPRTALTHTQAGKPQQNGYVERYNRAVRHEWLGNPPRFNGAGP